MSDEYINYIFKVKKKIFSIKIFSLQLMLNFGSNLGGRLFAYKFNFYITMMVFNKQILPS
jgi:hypothetical protein